MNLRSQTSKLFQCGWNGNKRKRRNFPYREINGELLLSFQGPRSFIFTGANLGLCVNRSTVCVSHWCIGKPYQRENKYRARYHSKGAPPPSGLYQVLQKRSLSHDSQSLAAADKTKCQRTSLLEIVGNHYQWWCKNKAGSQAKYNAVCKE